jgi:hypothetical protein
MSRKGGVVMTIPDIHSLMGGGNLRFTSIAKLNRLYTCTNTNYGTPKALPLRSCIDVDFAVVILTPSRCFFLPWIWSVTVTGPNVKA